MEVLFVVGKSANERKRLYAQWRREERERLKAKVKNEYGNTDKTAYSAITGNDISLNATTWNLLIKRRRATQAS